VPFADLKLESEFGQTVYGPLRDSETEAIVDLRDFRKAAAAGAAELRKEVAIKGGQGGTGSRVPWSGREVVLKRVGEIYAHLHVAPEASSFAIVASHNAVGAGTNVDDVDDNTTDAAAETAAFAPSRSRLWGSRRSFISTDTVHLSPNSPISPTTLTFLRRSIDFIADLLGACVDVGFHLLPDFDAVVLPTLREVFKTELPLLEDTLHIEREIFENLAHHAVFASDLKVPTTARDAAAIAGFVKQLGQRAHSADAASKKAASKARKRLNKLKNSQNRTLVIYNVSKTADEELLRAALGDRKCSQVADYPVAVEAAAASGAQAGDHEGNLATSAAELTCTEPSLIKQMTFAKTPDGKFRGYVFVVTRNSKVAEAMLALNPPPTVCGRMLKIKRHALKDDVRTSLIGWGPTSREEGHASVSPDEGGHEDFSPGAEIPVPYKQATFFALPEQLQLGIRNIVTERPGCNIGVIKQRIGSELDPAKYGFKNLVQMLASIPELQLRKHYGANPQKVAYSANLR
jgi:hypothetical protein